MDHDGSFSSRGAIAAYVYANIDFILRIVVIGILLFMCVQQQNQMNSLRGMRTDINMNMNMTTDLKAGEVNSNINSSTCLHTRRRQQRERRTSRVSLPRDRDEVDREAVLMNALESYEASVDNALDDKLRAAYEVMTSGRYNQEVL